MDRNRCAGDVGHAPHEASVDEADQGDEQPDPHRDGDLQLGWYGVEHRRPEAGQHQQQDDDALDDDQTHGVGPGHLGRDAERHEGVQTEACGERQREVGDHPHQDGHHTRHERRAGRDGREVRRVTATEELAVHVLDEPEDERVQRNDVDHRDPGDDTTAHLTTDGRSALGDLEEAVQAGRSLCCDCRHGSSPLKKGAPTC